MGHPTGSQDSMASLHQGLCVRTQACVHTKPQLHTSSGKGSTSQEAPCSHPTTTPAKDPEQEGELSSDIIPSPTSEGRTVWVPKLFLIPQKMALILRHLSFITASYGLWEPDTRCTHLPPAQGSPLTMVSLPCQTYWKTLFSHLWAHSCRRTRFPAAGIEGGSDKKTFPQIRINQEEQHQVLFRGCWPRGCSSMQQGQWCCFPSLGTFLHQAALLWDHQAQLWPRSVLSLPPPLP